MNWEWLQTTSRATSCALSWGPTVSSTPGALVRSRRTAFCVRCVAAVPGLANRSVVDDEEEVVALPNSRPAAVFAGAAGLDRDARTFTRDAVEIQPQPLREGGYESRRPACRRHPPALGQRPPRRLRGLDGRSIGGPATRKRPEERHGHVAVATFVRLEGRRRPRC